MEFVVTSVNVADDVEWSMLIFPIVPEPLSFDTNRVNFFRC